jgi:hypothetical protein
MDVCNSVCCEFFGPDSIRWDISISPTSGSKQNTWLSFYLVFSYGFWIARLLRTFRQPQLDFNRIISKYILLGQVAAFTIPLVTALAIFIFGYSFPLNLAAPFADSFSDCLVHGCHHG